MEIPVEESDDSVDTILHKAIFNHNEVTVTKLITEGAYVNAEDDTPLYLACNFGCESIVKLLLTLGGNVNNKNCMH